MYILLSCFGHLGGTGTALAKQVIVCSEIYIFSDFKKIIHFREIARGKGEAALVQLTRAAASLGQ